jgi:hypothetical protein
MIRIENNKFLSFLSSWTSIRETVKEVLGRIKEAKAKCHNRREFTSIDSMRPKTEQIDSIQPGGNATKFTMKGGKKIKLKFDQFNKILY